jgi:hypothetical protein
MFASVDADQKRNKFCKKIPAKQTLMKLLRNSLIVKLNIEDFYIRQPPYFDVECSSKGRFRKKKLQFPKKTGKQGKWDFLNFI